MFKSSEEREAARREREAARAREEAAQAERASMAEEQRQRAAFLATPVGAATAAKEAGQPCRLTAPLPGQRRRPRVRAGDRPAGAGPAS